MRALVLCIAGAAFCAASKRWRIHCLRKSSRLRKRACSVIAVAGSSPVEVLYNDGLLVAVNKPAGLVVHCSALVREETTLMGLLKEAIGPSIAPINRLDRGTSGVMLLSMDAEATRLTKAELEGNSFRKVYVAMVRGMTHEQGVVDTPMTRVTKKARRRVHRKMGRVPGTDAEEVPAITRYKRLSQTECMESKLYETRYSLLELEIEYGRMHQIRRHMSRIAHPVIGDAQHGKSEHNRFIRETFGLHRLALHAYSLHLSHPITREELNIVAPLPDDLAQPLLRMNLLQHVDLVRP